MTPADRLIALAEELRGIAAAGLYYGTDEYDRARYHRVRRLAAEALALTETRSADELERLFLADLTERTALATADAAVFDGSGRLLLTRRRDCGQWCMPGGLTDVGETPAEAAERETREETGMEVRAVALYGLYDNRRISDTPRVQTYCAVFRAEWVSGTPQVTSETCDVGWFDRAAAAELELFRGHRVKVPDAFDLFEGKRSGAVFH
ncbi:ADP-ribose pyrophosphatase YjhB (NUDIX family) [Stackebrandtia albiflava]|uniref:ADP-ribose pyrophosphatase YjhB (NUDIX family) n=1 Tax=Stackebrandtia albiflava TaxID=406432 RepID=A0A562VEM6_9ACTN|nr:NUDIX hydrolase N-terminal domain-containing protein [Stackebrandtia albiflava]TWJ16339.1 ADP-ribose pyrophosphatase YjhB (NUDIX family) [Stackebrandtia albiflava]